MKKIIVVYHNNCLDGFSGAWCAWKKFGSDAGYIGASRDQEPIMPIGADEVYYIDFTYPAAITAQIVRQNKKVVILDHHISEQAAVALAHDSIFDNARCGAVIAWQYFHPNAEIPELLKHVQDNDLFTLRLSMNREIVAALSIEPYDFLRYSELADALQTDEGREHFCAVGATLVRAEEHAVQRLLACAEPVVFEGYETLAVNTIMHYSQTAAAMYLTLGYPCGIAWSYRQNGMIHVSLRSDGNRVNCAELAQKYGGGGHEGAAGFIAEFTGAFPWARAHGKIPQASMYDGTPATAPKL